MKRTVICIFLMIACLAVSLSACSLTPEAPGKNEKTTEASQEIAFYDFDITPDESSLIFSYFYIGEWNTLKYYTEQQHYKIGDEGFDPSVSPKNQKYVNSKSGESVVWSDRITSVATKKFNSTFAIFEAAKSEKYVTDSMIDDVDSIIEQVTADAKKAGMKEKEYLEGLYGEGFSVGLMKKVATVELASSYYEKAHQKKLISLYDGELQSYEEVSEYVMQQSSKDIDDIVSSYTRKIFDSSVQAVKGTQTALGIIESTIASKQK